MALVTVGTEGKLPTRGTPDSAGLDLYAAETITITPGKVNRVPTDIRMALPRGTYGQIAARSGLAAKYGYQILAGVIDRDYRGEIIVLCSTPTQFIVSKGDRIAQLLIVRCDMSELTSVDSLEQTERADGGFGSTGV
jgi:dUTP pyrophosphatase